MIQEKILRGVYAKSVAHGIAALAVKDPMEAEGRHFEHLL
jgi:hypothetical protein